MPAVRADVKTAFFVGFLVLGAAVGAAALVAVTRKLAAEGVAAGAMIAWAVLAIAAAFAIPGASYLFAWPLVAAAIVHAARSTMLAAHVVVATIAIVLLVPLAAMLAITFGPDAAPAVAWIAALVTTASVPALDAVARAGRAWIAPALLACAGLACIVLAATRAPFDADAPHPDTLAYALDADRGEASWVSFDAAPDAWTSKLLANATPAPAADIVPRDPSLRALRAPAPATALDHPRVDVVADSREGAMRTLRARVVAPPEAELLVLHAPADARIASATLAGKPLALSFDGALDLYFFGPPAAGLDLTITCAAGPIRLRLVTQSSGFPASVTPLVPARPPDTMPRPGSLPPWDELQESDRTLVTTALTL
jgi:hypothetical protein